jgi:hypothetical protein
MAITIQMKDLKSWDVTVISSPIDDYKSPFCHVHFI